MKAIPLTRSTVRRTLSAAFLSLALALLGFLFAAPASLKATAGSAQSQPRDAARQQAESEPPDVAAFRAAVGGEITPLVIELKREPGVLRKAAAEQQGEAMSVEDLMAYAQELVGEQDAFRASLAQQGVRALMRSTEARQVDGSTRHIEYRFTYLLNGFVAYVATADIERLRKLPEVAHVSEAESPTFFLDKAIDYSLGTQTNPSDRRTAVYGPTQEFDPQPGVPGHPEAPRTTQIDGFEGQKMRIAVIDSGVDWRHPMFGGIGQLTATPRVSGQPERPEDNRKVIYYYALSSPGDPTDDFGHGTLVASCAAGYTVDGNTPPRLGYGTGRDGTGVGPTINGAQLFGTAPQAQIMAYKVCGPAPQCPGDIPLAIEDAASPFTLVASGNPGPTPVRKPVADVINLSLGSTNGDPASATSRASNNASLAGTIVVTSAGNSGPGASTVGAPGAATLALTVAASLDPGSISASDVLAPDQIPGETRTPGTPGPAPETGAASNANAPQPGERQGIKIFPVAGGGAIPGGSLSAHYVFVDRRDTPPAPVPPSVGNRIAVVKGSGTFASIANPVAANVPPPAAIIIVTTVESATAVAVVNGVPTFTMSPADADYLLGLMGAGAEPPNGTISTLPLRLAESFSLASFQPSMAGFSSRGPLNHPNARFRVIKPDVSAPGVGINGAATVEGLPDETIGLASLSGYTTANGTSFSSPITAGAITLVRQYVRETLGIDLTDSLADQMNPNWRARRFEAVTVARALLMNSATNLRSGLGVPQGDGAASIASVNDMGAGHINIAAALQGKAIMVVPEALLSTPAEYSPATGPLTVMIPSASFGEVPVVNVNGTITRSREVVLRDVAGGAGAGVYNLTVQNNRAADAPGFQISFAQMDGTPISSVVVPAGGQVSFRVVVQADGRQIGIDGTEFQWYVTATAASGQTLRMPFFYRAVAATVPNITAPNQAPPTGTEGGGTCPTDTNGSYNVNWTYTPPPGGGASPVGFRIQEATRSESIFFDAASEPLVAGANSVWTGSAQWNSATNPNSGNLAYYIPDAANQDESLAMRNAILIPPGGATLSYVTTEDTEEGFDFARVEISTDGVSYTTLASFSGFFAGTRAIDISAYAGQAVRIRFRLTSDLVMSAPGWWVEAIRISSDDFRAIAEVASPGTSLALRGKPAGTYSYRVAALFPNPVDPSTTVTGPYSNLRCVTVVAGPAADSAVSRKTHGGAGTFDVNLPFTGSVGIEPRRSQTPGQHQVVFTFAGPVTVFDGASVEAPKGGMVSGVTVNGATVAVDLSGVGDAQRVRVTLNGVSNGSTTGAVSVLLGVLLGDTTSDAVVNAADTQQTRSRSGQIAASANFRSDVNTDGTVNSADAVLVRGNSGAALDP